MKKQILFITITFITLNSNFAKVGSIGLQKVNNSVIDALKNSQKLDENSFKQFIQKSKEKKKVDPKNKLANIIIASQGSTIKGLPLYSSKIEKEVTEQIEYSQDLTNNFIKLANQFTLVELMEKEEVKNNSFDALSMLNDLIAQNYKNEETIFTDFAKDLNEEKQNIDEQIKVLNTLKNLNEVKENNKLNEKIQDTLSQLNLLKENIYKFIEKVNFLVGNSLKLLSVWLMLSKTESDESIIEEIVDTVTENLMEDITENRSVNLNEEILKGDQEEEEPEIISTLPQESNNTPPSESGNHLMFRPFYA